MPLTPRELVAAFYADLWNRRDPTRLHELLHEDFRFRGSLGSERRGPQAFWTWVELVTTALGEYRCEELASVAEGSRVFARMRFSGIHRGEFRGFAPTGERVEWEGAALFETRDARIVEAWVLGDLQALDTCLRAAFGAE